MVLHKLVIFRDLWDKPNDVAIVQVLRRIIGWTANGFEERQVNGNR